jgi:hypothetical protein
MEMPINNVERALQIHYTDPAELANDDYDFLILEIRRLRGTGAPKKVETSAEPPPSLQDLGMVKPKPKVELKRRF